MARLNPQQVVFVEQMARTNDPVYSAAKAGYASPSKRASQNLALPQVQAEIAKRQTERLFSEALPAAVDCVVEIITNKNAPPGARVQAAKVVFDRTLGSEEGAKSKEPHEMTGEELAQAINALERVAADRARPVEEQPAESPGDIDLFA